MKTILSKDATFDELYKFFIGYTLHNFYTKYTKSTNKSVYYTNIELEVFYLYKKLNIIYKDKNKEEILEHCSDYIIIPDLEEVLKYCWINYCGYCRTIGSVFYNMSSGGNKLDVKSVLKVLEQKFNPKEDNIQDYIGYVGYENDLHKLLSNTFEEYAY